MARETRSALTKTSAGAVATEGLRSDLSQALLSAKTDADQALGKVKAAATELAGLKNTLGERESAALKGVATEITNVQARKQNVAG